MVRLNKRGAALTLRTLIILVLLVALLIWVFVGIFPKLKDGGEWFDKPLEGLEKDKLKLMNWDSLTLDQQNELSEEDKAMVQLASAERMFEKAKDQWSSGDYGGAVKDLERVVVLTSELMTKYDIYDADQRADIEDLKEEAEILLKEARVAYGRDLMNSGYHDEAIKQFENAGDNENLIEHARGKKEEFEEAKNALSEKYGFSFSEVGCIDEDSEPEIVWCAIDHPAVDLSKARILAQNLSKFVKENFVYAGNDFHLAKKMESESSPNYYWLIMNAYENALFKHGEPSLLGENEDFAKNKLKIAADKEEYKNEMEFSKIMVYVKFEFLIEEDSCFGNLVAGENAIYRANGEEYYDKTMTASNTLQQFKVEISREHFTDENRNAYLRKFTNNDDYWLDATDSSDGWAGYGPECWTKIDEEDNVKYEINVVDGLNNLLCFVDHHSEGENIDEHPTLNLKDCDSLIELKVVDFFTDGKDFENTEEEWVEFNLTKI